MGTCFGCLQNNIKVAIKVPHGIKYLEYENNEFTYSKSNIDEWLSTIYNGKSWTQWVLYNDETSKLDIHTTNKGHCKGIVAWNTSRISWLCHSVPNFPRSFTGFTIHPLEPNEHVYGQSFHYVEIRYSLQMITDILQQLHLMKAHIYNETNHGIKTTDLHDTLRVLQLTNTITHIAKSPKHEIDIYNYLATTYKCKWYVETWIRGHRIEPTDSIVDITNLHIHDIDFKESQDHSKWACSDDYYWVGDLNRMTSQYKRGGGGFVCKNRVIARSFKKLIKM